MKIISVANQKGGVAKTTTVSNLAWGLAERGKKVLVVDFDPQGNLSQGMGATINNNSQTIYEMLGLEANKAPAKFENVVQKSFGVDILPADDVLAKAERELFFVNKREEKLENVLAPLKKQYDYCFIDCQPSLGMLPIIALAASDEVLVPLKAAFYSHKGMELFINSVKEVKRDINSKLRFNGFLITQLDTRVNSEEDIDNITAMAQQVNSFVYETKIRTNVQVERLPKFSTSIFRFDNKSNGAKDYTAFVEEFLLKEKK